MLRERLLFLFKVKILLVLEHILRFYWERMILILKVRVIVIVIVLGFPDTVNLPINVLWTISLIESVLIYSETPINGRELPLVHHLILLKLLRWIVSVVLLLVLDPNGCVWGTSICIRVIIKVRASQARGWDLIFIWWVRALNHELLTQGFKNIASLFSFLPNLLCIFNLFSSLPSIFTSILTAYCRNTLTHFIISLLYFY